jgi:hypothetical protein
VNRPMMKKCPADHRSSRTPLRLRIYLRIHVAGFVADPPMWLETAHRAWECVIQRNHNSVLPIFPLIVQVSKAALSQLLNGRRGKS